MIFMILSTFIKNMTKNETCTSIKKKKTNKGNKHKNNPVFPLLRQTNNYLSFMLLYDYMLLLYQHNYGSQPLPWVDNTYG